MTFIELAYKYRKIIEDAMQSVDDAVALETVDLFPAWAVGVDYIADARVKYNGVLYKCRQSHISQSDWTPNNTSALWAAVSIDPGTNDRPIEAVRGMEYEQGKYYLDTEDNNVYLCTRSGVLHYIPHELAGQYFELAA